MAEALDPRRVYAKTAAGVAEVGARWEAEDAAARSQRAAESKSAELRAAE